MPQNSARGYQRLMGSRRGFTNGMGRIDEGNFRDGDEGTQPFERHADGHEQDDHQAQPGNPAMLVQEARDEGGGNAHHHDRKGQADDQRFEVMRGRAGHGQHVVERHGDVGDDDLDDRLAQRLARRLAGHGAIGVLVGVFQRFLGLVLILLRGGELAVHLPAHIEQQDAAGDQQAPAQRQELSGDQRKTDAEDGGGGNADEDGAAATPVVGEAELLGDFDNDSNGDSEDIDNEDIFDDVELDDIELDSVELAATAEDEE